jgi:hypothetical protein
MRSMQCNVEFGYQLSIRSGTKENHGKPWSSWPVAGPSGCKLTTGQQSGVEYASPNIVYLSMRLLYYNIRIQFVLQLFYIHIIWISKARHRNRIYTCIKRNDPTEVHVSHKGKSLGRCAVRKTVTQTHRAGKSMGIRLYCRYRILDYYFIFVQSQFPLLGFSAIRHNKLPSLSAKFC